MEESFEKIVETSPMTDCGVITCSDCIPLDSSLQLRFCQISSLVSLNMALKLWRQFLMVALRSLFSLSIVIIF